MDGEGFPLSENDDYAEWDSLATPENSQLQPSPLDELAAAGEDCSPDQ
jgi:hypothetical protein